jgi:hypothetical protein
VSAALEGGAAQGRIAPDEGGEVYLGKKQKFLSVVCDLKTGEPRLNSWRSR